MAHPLICDRCCGFHSTINCPYNMIDKCICEDMLDNPICKHHGLQPHNLKDKK